MIKPPSFCALIRSHLQEEVHSLRQQHENGDSGMRRVPGANHKLPL